MITCGRVHAGTVSRFWTREFKRCDRTERESAGGLAIEGETRAAKSAVHMNGPER